MGRADLSVGVRWSRSACVLVAHTFGACARCAEARELERHHVISSSRFQQRRERERAWVARHATPDGDV